MKSREGSDLSIAALAVHMQAYAARAHSWFRAMPISTPNSNVAASITPPP